MARSSKWVAEFGELVPVYYRMPKHVREVLKAAGEVYGSETDALNIAVLSTYTDWQPSSAHLAPRKIRPK